MTVLFLGAAVVVLTPLAAVGVAGIYLSHRIWQDLK